MVICEAELRARLGGNGERVVRLRGGDVFTPAARDFIKEHGFRVESAGGDHPCREMPRTPIPAGGERRFIDLDGNGYAAKPEHMTHLHGNVLAPKHHPRIALRGKLDSFQAMVLAAQTAAGDEGRSGVRSSREGILPFGGIDHRRRSGQAEAALTRGKLRVSWCGVWAPYPHE